MCGRRGGCTCIHPLHAGHRLGQHARRKHGDSVISAIFSNSSQPGMPANAQGLGPLRTQKHPMQAGVERLGRHLTERPHHHLLLLLLCARKAVGMA